MLCQRCHKDIQPQAKFCKYCGHPQDSDQKLQKLKNQNTLLMVGTTIAVIVAAGLFLQQKGIFDRGYQFDKPAQFTGTFHQGVFENCCTNGESVNTPYFYLTLPKEATFNGGINGTFKQSDIQIERIVNAFSSVRDGQTITVVCKDLWEGTTGHYALSVYCKDPSIK